MPPKVRWGIISTANIGLKRVIPAIHASRNGEVAAVASRSLDKAQAFAAQTGIPRAYGSYDDLIADPEIDAIYNPLPNSEHAAWSIRCAEAGKPVLCEKPLARDAAEAQTMADAFAARGLLFAEAFMYRFHPQTQQVVRMIEAGAVGQVMAVQATFTFAIASEDDIRLSQPLAGGALMDVGCYCVSVIRLLTRAEPTRVNAVAMFGSRSGVDEAVAGVLGFDGGVVAHFDCGLRAFRAHTYEVRGTRGRIQVPEGFIMEPGAATIIRHWQGARYDEIDIGPADHYQLMVEDFADALLAGRAPRYTPQDAVANMRVLDSLKAAARPGSA
jgi:predicted dehydrogenase